jgi:hypothetical protein
LTAGKVGPYGRGIRNRHLKQLVDTAASLGGPRLETALWRRLQSFSNALPSPPEQGPAAPAETQPRSTQPLSTLERAEIARLRGLVASSLQALARALDQTLAQALATARQAWEKVDSQALIDPTLDASLGVARRALELAVVKPGAVGAVALEGITVLEVARGLVALAEQRMSSLIRLRLQQAQASAAGAAEAEALLPGGRPFLDLSAAIAEVGRAWA